MQISEKSTRIIPKNSGRKYKNFASKEVYTNKKLRSVLFKETKMESLPLTPS